MAAVAAAYQKKLVADMTRTDIDAALADARDWRPNAAAPR
jgi:hypothetical protein